MNYEDKLLWSSELCEKVKKDAVWYYAYFIQAVNEQGYYLFVNPITKPATTNIQDANFDIDEVEEWKQAESRTLKNPLIFEIL